MNNPYFNNLYRETEKPAFFFVGELKAYGLNHFFGKSMKRMFGKDYQPITLAPDMIDMSTYIDVIIINPGAKEAEEKAGRLIAYRTPGKKLAQDVSKDEFAQAVIGFVEKNQDEVPIWMFESRPELKLGPKSRIFGPDPSIIEQLNDKTWQYEFFSKIVPVVDFCICNGLDELEASLTEMDDKCPHGMFVSASHSAGGASSMIVSCADEASGKFVARDARYFISRYQPHDYDPTVLAVVDGEGQVFVGGVADMNIVDGNKFRGSTYPSVLSANIQERLRQHTVDVGKAISEMGYRGIFGCDYIVSGDDIYFIELNPRKQGTTMEFCCGMEQLLPEGAPNLIDLECEAVINGKFSEDWVQPDYEAICEGGLHWGTFNLKADEDVETSSFIPQQMAEQDLFAKVVEEGGSDHIILEHVGADVLVKAGTFVGRVAAVGTTHEAMLKELEKGKERLQATVVG